MAFRIEDRAVIALVGEEARGFLQGLVTNDLNGLAPDKPVYCALLTPQGKILFDFLVCEDAAGSLLLECGAPARDALIKRLGLYRLRAKIEIRPRNDLAAYASWDGTGLPGIAFTDPRLAALGRRTIAPRTETSPDDYLAHRLSLGVPEGADFGSDKMFALDAGLDELHAVSFEKGCYVGQELTARMKHRGTARKRLLLIESEANPLPATGTAVTVAGQSIGEITSIYGARGFAIIRLDRLEQAGSSAIDAGGVSVRVIKQPWISA